MDELHKASLLLKHLASQEREQILGRLPIEQRQQLELMIDQAPEVPHAELVEIVSEYQSWLQRLSVKPDRTQEFAESVDPVVSLRVDDTSNRQFTALDIETLAEKLLVEPATVLSAVLCQLHESTAQELFATLENDRKAAVVARLPKQKELQPIVQEELSRSLSEPASGSDREINPGEDLLARLVGA